MPLVCGMETTETSSEATVTMKVMKTIYLWISLAVIVLGSGFVIDNLEGWDSFSVVAAIAGWTVILTGLLHLFVALGRETGDAVRWLAAASGTIVTVLVVLGWTMASFARDWPEVSTVILLVTATVLAVARRPAASRDAPRDMG